MSVVIFVGPTLSVEEARRHLDARYLPPVSAGDICTLVNDEQPSVIGIIDGFFELVPAVWHKEILFALSRGVRVFGASSMGALRAAELAAFGMEGVGAIAESFLSGELEDDDEVTLVHGAADTGYRQISEAMVNLRWGLSQAARDGWISAATETSLIALAKSWHYTDRSWGSLFARAAEAGVPSDDVARLRTFVSETKPNLKRDDAVKMLQRVAQVQSEPPPVPPAFDFLPTRYWLSFVEDCRGRSASHRGHVAAGSVLRHLRLTDPQSAIARDALLEVLVHHEAERREVQADEEQIARETRRFFRARCLSSDAQRAAFLGANDVLDDDVREIARTEVLIREIARTHERSLAERLPLVLKRGEKLRSVSQSIAAKRSIRERCAGSPTLADAGILLPELVEWYESRFQELDDELDLDENARMLGFEDGRDFLEELILEYLEAAEPDRRQGA